MSGAPATAPASRASSQVTHLDRDRPPDVDRHAVLVAKEVHNRRRALPVAVAGIPIRKAADPGGGAADCFFGWSGVDAAVEIGIGDHHRLGIIEIAIMRCADPETGDWP